MKTKSKQENVELLKAEDFFKRLHNLSLVKSPRVKDNLCKFLCIDESYLGSLMFKKLLRACKDFKESQALSGIGIKKLPLPVLNKPQVREVVSSLPPLMLPKERVIEKVPSPPTQEQVSLKAPTSVGNILAPPSEASEEEKSEYEYDEEDVSYD